jgi:glycosyltransferase involved in cell wall biosynthesis
VSLPAALDAVRTAPRIVDALRLAEGLAFAARRDDGLRTVRTLTDATRGEDGVVAIAALHALGQVPDAAADASIRDVLSTGRPFLREHAAWVLGSRLPAPEAVADLVRLVAAGGFGGMLAQRTLERWAAASAVPVGLAVEAAALGEPDSRARARLVETLGLVPGEVALGRLLRLAADEREAEPVRLAATAALGERRGPAVAALLDRLARQDDPQGDVARLALADVAAAPPHADFGGPTVAQLFLHADLEPALDTAGRGDNGGIATLLVRLGDALLRRAPDGRVLTLSRGSVVEARAALMAVSEGAPGHVYGRVPLLADPVPAAEAWPLRVAARRGITRVLRSAGRVDAIHLRMGDVGSLAAAEVARRLDIPTVFTLAPDPHAVIDALERSGVLDRGGFGEADLREHYWFRARLVERLAADAAHTVLLPRPQLARDLGELVGVDLEDRPTTVGPEGIDLAAVDRAGEEVSGALVTATALPALDDLRALLRTLPEERRRLPLLLSVGRLHRVKGMDRIAAAWSGRLSERANLVLVGGALEAPSADERQQLDRIRRLVPAGADAGLLLAGSRPNDVVLRWLAAAREGVPGLAASGGAYVCGSVKEEFGIAILEAMAAGLPVVAPDGGGPATYVEDGRTGRLVDTADPAALARAMADVLELAARGGAEPAEVVHRRFSIDAMAAALGGVYDALGAERTTRGLEEER